MENIRSQKSTTILTVEELKKLEKPIQKAIYKRPKPIVKNNISKKAHWNDKIECTVCGKTFTRSSRTYHNRSQYHQIHYNMNEKIKNLLLTK